MHVLSAMGHCAPRGDLHAESLRVEIDRPSQVANPNAGVVETALHDCPIRAQGEVLSPVLRRAWSPIETTLRFGPNASVIDRAESEIGSLNRRPPGTA